MSFAHVSMRVADSIAAYRIVRCNGVHQVGACSAATDIIFGVTQDEATKSNQAVPVAVAGIARVYMNDTLAAGALIATDASGRGIPLTESTAGAYSLGVLLETVSSTGTIAQVLVRPQRLNDVP